MVYRTGFGWVIKSSQCCAKRRVYSWGLGCGQDLGLGVPLAAGYQGQVRVKSGAGEDIREACPLLVSKPTRRRPMGCDCSYSNVVAAAAADATDVKLCLHCRPLRNFYSSASDREKKLHSSRLLRLTCSCSNQNKLLQQWQRQPASAPSHRPIYAVRQEKRTIFSFYEFNTQCDLTKLLVNIIIDVIYFFRNLH